MATYETRKSVLADGSVTDVTLDTSDINARLIYNISEDAFSFRTETENVTLSCAWWSESTRSWRSDGCQLKSFNSSSIICECTHMTSFGWPRPPETTSPPPLPNPTPPPTPL